MHRPLSNIAHDIRRDMSTNPEWRKKYYSALPYLSAMLEIDQVGDQYMYDSGRSIVNYFLANASKWTGPVARTIKAELRKL